AVAARGSGSSKGPSAWSAWPCSALTKKASSSWPRSARPPWSPTCSWSCAASRLPSRSSTPARCGSDRPRGTSVTERKSVLLRLDPAVHDGDRSGLRVVALCGLGGAGKTSVAVEYAHRQLGEVGVAWQFSAEDPTVLAAGFGELAAQLGARDVVDTRDPIASVHGVLAAFPAGWLLVFDNAPDLASVQAFLPPAG